ncbi:MAG: alpha/beta hydrolase [Beijerinckiaceae bacterium]
MFNDCVRRGGSAHWSFARLLRALLFSAIVAGCASRAENVLTPLSPEALASARGASRVEMLVATTRLAAPQTPGEMYSGERAPVLTYADIAISIPPDASRTIGEVQWPQRLPADPARDFVTVKANVVDRGKMMTRLREEARQNGGRVLLFVHGFNNKFEDAVMRFAQIAHDSGARAASMLFTWPSRGKLLAYGYDHESANYSRDSLESVLDMLSAEPAVREVSVLAHSMGNWVTLEALRQSAIRRGRVPSKVQNVMLASPDVDVDVFRTQIASLGASRPNLTLFVSQDDTALRVSRRVWGSVPRIGAVNPEMEPYRSEFLANRITVLDLTKVSTEGSLNHDKFATSPEIVRLIGGRLVAGQQINDGKVTLGEGVHLLAADTASTIGGVVGGIVSAPVKLLEGKKPIDLE